MRNLFTFMIVMLMLLMIVPVMPAQTSPDVSNLYAAGVSYNNNATPAVAGTALWAHKATDNTGTYAFTVVDALPNTLKPFTVNTNFSAGIAQKVLTIGNVPIFVPTAAGISFNGDNTGWAWSTGAMLDIKIKEHWRILPNVRVVKSSVTGGTGYQPVVGVLFGWGE
jgi:hypothetical protein